MITVIAVAGAKAVGTVGRVDDSVFAPPPVGGDAIGADAGVGAAAGVAGAPAGPWPPLVEVVPAPAPGTRRLRVPVALGACVALLVAGLLGLAVVQHRTSRTTQQVTSRTLPPDPTPDPGAVAAAALAGAAPATRAAGTAHVHVTFASTDGGQPSTATIDGVTELAGPRYDLTFSVADPAVPAGIGLEGPEHVISDGATAWASLPPTMAQLMGMDLPAKQAKKLKQALAGKQWVEAPLGGDAGISNPLEDIGFGLDGSASGFGFDAKGSPSGILGYLQAISAGSPQRVGPIQLDDGPGTRYSLAIDIDALQRGLSPDDRDLDAYDLRADVPHTFPATVDLDGAGRLRRLDWRLDLSTLLTPTAMASDDYRVEDCPTPDPALVTKAMHGDRTAQRTLEAGDEQCTDRAPRPEELLLQGTFELSAYGAPLTITAPPAAQVLQSDALDGLLFPASGDVQTVGPPPTTAP